MLKRTLEAKKNYANIAGLKKYRERNHALIAGKTIKINEKV